MNTNRDNIGQVNNPIEGTQTNQDAREGNSAMDEEIRTVCEKVQKALKIGQFDSALQQNIIQLDKFANAADPSSASGDELLNLKIKCTLAEAYDYFGEIESSDKLLTEGSKTFYQLKALEGVEPPDRKIKREQIRFCLNHAYVFLYRAHKYEEAKERILWCRDFVKNMLSDKEVFPCYGTLAQAEFFLGRTYRRLNQYDEAEECFGRAIEYYYKRAKRKQEECENNESKRQEEITFSNYKSAICLGIGLGWVNFARGHLKKAILHNILPERVWLVDTEDKLHIAYLDLLYGSAKRSEGGRKDNANLREAIQSIESAYQVFVEHNHVPNIAHAALELSLAYLYAGEVNEARSKLTEMESKLGEGDKSRWECPRLLLLSRISRERGDYLEAEKLATKALEHAKQEQVPYKIEARIVRSEARISLKENEKARTDLLKALDLNESGKKQANPKVEAVCQLHLARIYAREHDGREANRCFNRWKELEKEVEHKIIHEIARDVEKEIEGLSKDFVIPADVKNLSYNDHLKRLQEFLVDQAKQRTRTIQETTRELGISRQTLHQWQKERKS